MLKILLFDSDWNLVRIPKVTVCKKSWLTFLFSRFYVFNDCTILEEIQTALVDAVDNTVSTRKVCPTLIHVSFIPRMASS